MKSMFAIIVFVIYLIINYYVFRHIWIAMPPSTMGRVALISIAVIVILSLVLSLVIGDALPVTLASILYKIGTTWFFILIYFFIVMAVKDLFGLSNKLLHFMPGDAITRYTRENWVGLGLMVGFIALLMVCG
ncbi:MAG: metallophosphoesterase, partial [Prevotella sp.]|nr:metallophosphoesterase [Prevotella sp.]